MKIGEVVRIPHGKGVVRKQAKNHIEGIFRREGSWYGIIVGNNVNPYHWLGGWGLGVVRQWTSIDEWRDFVMAYENALDPELGNRAAFFTFIGSEVHNGGDL